MDSDPDMDRTDTRNAPPQPGSPARARILIADDHEVMRTGLAQLLSHEPDLEIVGQASDGQIAVELTRALLPDIVLMDLSMPRLTGLQATRILHKELPHIHIIALSMFEEKERSKAMLSAGAAAYLTKSAPADHILAAIRRCIDHRT